MNSASIIFLIHNKRQRNEKCKEGKVWIVDGYDDRIKIQKNTHIRWRRARTAHKFVSNGSSSFSGRLLIISIFIEHISAVVVTRW